MDKIKISSEDIGYILKWRDEHQGLVRRGVVPLNAVKIICFETDYIITAIKRGNTINFWVNKSGRSLGKLVFEILEDGKCKLIKNTTELNSEDRQGVLTVYFSLMAIFVFEKTPIYQSDEYRENYDTSVENQTKSKKSNKKSKRDGYTYILKRSERECRFMPEGFHNSPSGVFSVRGHYRYYKDGKIVWINQYLKGTRKRKDKTYKL